MSEVIDIVLHTDPHGQVAGYAGGNKVIAVWGPAVEGDWFVWVAGQGDPRRVATREEALALLPARWPVPDRDPTRPGPVEDQDATHQEGGPMPVFPILAKDALAPGIIAAYRDLCLATGATAQAGQVQLALDEVVAWQATNPGQVAMPDHRHIPAAGGGR